MKRSPTSSNRRLSAATRGRAFTLFELLIAIALTLLMLVAINRIFSDARRAIGGGVSLSRIQADSRAMLEQIHRDTELMIGPHRRLRKPMLGSWIEPEHGGILVIVQREIEAPVPDVSGRGIATRMVRSDQLVFIRPRGDEDPIAPSGHNNYTSEHLLDADFIRVWYGHVRRTSPLGDGQHNPGQPDDPAAPGELGRPPETVIGSGNQNYVIDNELASQWILGRQALFLQTSDVGNSPSYALDGGNYFSATTGQWVRGLPAGIPVPRALFMGLTDVAWYGFDRPFLRWGDINPYHGQIVGGPPDFTVVDNAMRLFNLQPGVFANPIYIVRAVRYNTFARKRLRVTPVPAFDIQAGLDMPAWQVAQTHPFFLAGVSDFIVEFAGDYVVNASGAPGVDNEVDAVSPNPAYPADDTDAGTPARAYIHPGREVRWYDAYTEVNAADPRHEQNDPGTPADFDSTKSPRYEFPDAPVMAAAVPLPLTDVNPMMRDINTGLPGAFLVPHADHVFVFRHDDDGRYILPFTGGPAPGSMWPDKLRIRWRMHDPQNQLFDAATGQTGKWFELIVPVPRPLPR